MNKQAAMNTAMTVAALGAAGLGFVGMMMVAPLFTMTCLGLIGIGFLIRAVYNIEKSRIECEAIEQRLRELR